MSTTIDFFKAQVTDVPIGLNFFEAIEALEQSGRAEKEEVLRQLGIDEAELLDYKLGIKDPSNHLINKIKEYGVNAAFIYTNDDEQPILF